MSDCLFCQIVAGRSEADIVYQDEQILVFKDLYPKAPVHLLLIPKQHITNLMFVDENHQLLLGHLMVTLPKIAKMHGLDSFRTIINSGAESRQVIFHLHLHLLGGELLSS